MANEQMNQQEQQLLPIVDLEGPLSRMQRGPFALDDGFRGKENGRTKTNSEV